MTRYAGSEYEWPMIIAAFKFLSCVAFKAYRSVCTHKLRSAADIRYIVTEHAHRFLSHQTANAFGYLLFVAIDACLPE